MSRDDWGHYTGLYRLQVNLLSLLDPPCSGTGGFGKGAVSSGLTPLCLAGTAINLKPHLAKETGPEPGFGNNGKENGNYYSILEYSTGLSRDNGKENGNYIV